MWSTQGIKCHILRFYWLIFCQLHLKGWLSRQDWKDGYSQVSQSLKILTMTFIFHKKYLHKVIATGKLSVCKICFLLLYTWWKNPILGRSYQNQKYVFFVLHYFSIFYYKSIYSHAFTLFKTSSLTNGSPNIKMFLLKTSQSRLKLPSAIILYKYIQSHLTFSLLVTWCVSEVLNF